VPRRHRRHTYTSRARGREEVSLVSMRHRSSSMASPAPRSPCCLATALAMPPRRQSNSSASPPNTISVGAGWIGPAHQTRRGGPFSPGSGWPQPARRAALARATLPNTPLLSACTCIDFSLPCGAPSTSKQTRRRNALCANHMGLCTRFNCCWSLCSTFSFLFFFLPFAVVSLPLLANPTTRRIPPHDMDPSSVVTRAVSRVLSGAALGVPLNGWEIST
jgi:hypothetical protein